MTAAQRLYAEISRNDRYAGVRWIANVLFTSCSKPATRLKGLVALVDSGREVSTFNFTMPYEALVVDGRAVVALPALDAAAKGQQQLIAYSPASWFKY